MSNAIYQGAPKSLPNINPSLEELSVAELHSRREAIIARGSGSVQQLNDNDLTELVDILNMLRRRSSGPPKSDAAKRATGKKVNVQAASDLDIMEL